MTLNYPEVCQQAFIEPWWEEYTGVEFRPGRLVWAYLPHADQVPYTIIPIGRSDDPADHETARVEIKSFSIGEPVKKNHLPVAALPIYEKEKLCVYRAKKRPAVIISKGGPPVEKELTRDLPKSRTVPTVLVAPSYGADTGYRKEFIERVRHCEYPQFMWDLLPVGGKEKGSIIRLDHMQPVVRNTKTIEFTEYCLSEKAMVFVMEWVDWLISGQMDQKSALCETREFLMAL